MMFWGRSLVQEIYLLIGIQSYFSCACALRCPSVVRGGTACRRPPDSERHCMMWRDAVCCWVTEHEFDVQDCTAERERERGGGIDAAFSCLSSCIQSLSLQGHWKNHHISIACLWSGSFFFEFLSFCRKGRLFVTLVQPPTHTHKHTTHTVGGRGATPWSGLRSLQLSWCRLTDLYRQEKERKKERWK